MSEFVFMSDAAEFARYFIQSAIQTLPSNTLLQGKWLTSFMSVSQDINIPLNATYRSVTLSALLQHDVRLLAHGYIRKSNSGWDMGVFSFYVTSRMQWKVKGEVDKMGNFKFIDAFAVYSPRY